MVFGLVVDRPLFPLYPLYDSIEGYLKKSELSSC